MATASALIVGALADLGVLAAGETAAAEDAEAARLALNELGDSLGLGRLTLFRTVRTVKTLAASTPSYTIGSGAAISVPRPTWIDRAGLILDTTASIPAEVPLPVLTEEEYAAWPSKTETSSQPSAVYYDRGLSASGYGLIYPLPIPTVGTTQLVLYTPGVELSTFADLTTDYVLPRGYQRMLRKQLALELAPMFGVSQPSPLLVRQADESLRAVKMGNARALPLEVDEALLGRRRSTWNIETGRPR